MPTTLNKEDLKQCAETCFECFKVCSHTLYNHCLNQGGKHTEPGHFNLMQDCITICQASAELLFRGSESHKITCRACADVCEQCAANCERFDDQEMKACAAKCRECAQMCMQMSN